MQVDGRTMASRLPQEPDSVDPSALWLRFSHAELLPHDSNGKPWSVERLRKDGARLICQGPLGDCYHEAPLAVALQKDPRLVLSTTRPLGEHMGVRYYGVVYFVPAGSKAAQTFDRAGEDQGGMTPVWVVVDDLLPTHRDGTLVTGSVDIPGIHQKSLLNVIREKALARLHGLSGYRTVTHGGDAEKVMETISGYPSQKFSLERSHDPEEDQRLGAEQFEKLRQGVLENRITTMNTNLGDTRQVRKHLRDFQGPDGYFVADEFKFRDGAGNAASTDGTGQKSGQDSRTGYGWVGGHEYSILDARVVDGVPTVRLRNPWGDLCPPEFADKNREGKPVQSGYVNIPWKLARELFDTVKIGGRPPSQQDSDFTPTYPPRHGLPKELG